MYFFNLSGIAEWSDRNDIYITFNFKHFGCSTIEALTTNNVHSKKPYVSQSELAEVDHVHQKMPYISSQKMEGPGVLIIEKNSVQNSSLWQIILLLRL